MADNIEVKSKRDQHLARMREKYPDKKFEDDEEIYGQISEDYEQYEQELDGYRGREKAFSDMFISNPKSARLMMEWKDGKDPVASLIRIYGKEDILAAIEDPEKLEEIEKANKEFAERVAKNDEYETQYNKNLPASVEALEAWGAENGINDEEIDDAITELAQLCGDFILGKITPEAVMMMIKAKNHDADVDAAAMEGEVAGRNSKIKEELRKRQEGDGTAPLGGRNGSPVSGAPQRPKSVFDLAAQAK